MDYQGILEEIQEETRALRTEGRVADYIPDLTCVPRGKFGLALQTVDGDSYAVGDSQESFSLQSISKTFTLSFALTHAAHDLWLRVGREPSGSRFDSLVQLEYEHGRPRNPFINAGALVVSDLVLLHANDARAELLHFIRKLTGTNSIEFDQRIAESELANGFRNAALANFLKSHGKLDNSVEDVLRFYSAHCSLSMNCQVLAKSYLFLANAGVLPWSDEIAMTTSESKKINALLLTCGIYDGVGDFAYRVGMPAKSGVGGGIVAVIPGKLSIAVWSPGLDSAGNSLAGIRALELFTSKIGLSVF